MKDGREREIRALLEEDRVWCAYALADLDPPHSDHATWLTADQAVVLTYSGLTPPVLFAHGNPAQVLGLLQSNPPGTFQYTLLPTFRSLIGDALRPDKEVRMWRMSLRREDFQPEPDNRPRRLTEGDLPALDRLFAGQTDSPDSFAPRQLATGPFFGIDGAEGLVCVAGIHVVSHPSRLAAIGNVFTHPDARGQGMAGAASSAVASALLDEGIETIVLNVAMQNEAALRVYRRLGFLPFCGYYEGVGVLLDLDDQDDEVEG